MSQLIGNFNIAHWNTRWILRTYKIKVLLRNKYGIFSIQNKRDFTVILIKKKSKVLLSNPLSLIDAEFVINWFYVKVRFSCIQSVPRFWIYQRKQFFSMWRKMETDLLWLATPWINLLVNQVARLVIIGGYKRCSSLSFLSVWNNILHLIFLANSLKLYNRLRLI